MNTILVIRETDEASRILAANNYEIINLPLIETKPAVDLSNFEKKLAEIENYDGVFLTSRHAALILVEKLRAKNIQYKGKIYAFGKRSYDILKNKNFAVVSNGMANTAQEMLEKIAPEDLKNRRFLFIRGDKSLRVVPKFLGQFAEVDEAIVYETREISARIDTIKSLREKFTNEEIAAVCFFSPSGAESFLKQFGAEVLHQICIAAIGKTTADFLERQNLTVDFVSSKATAKDFAVGLVKYLERRNL